MLIPLLFDISGGELIVILLFVLMFFGAKGIPDIARTLGRTLRQVRDASNEVQREIQKGTTEVRRTFEEQRRDISAPEQPVTPRPTSEPGKDMPTSTAEADSADPKGPA